MKEHLTKILRKYGTNPLALFIGFLLIFKILKDIQFHAGFFLSTALDSNYEEIVWKYAGPSDLFKKLFKNRSELFYWRANESQSYLLLLLAIIFFFLLFKFGDRLKSVFAPKTANAYSKWLNYLRTPNRLVLILFLCLYIVLIMGFVGELHRSYLRGVNRRLGEVLNNYSNSRLDVGRSKKPQHPGKSAKTSESPICYFSSSRANSRIFSISILDFVYSALTGDAPNVQNIEQKIKELPKDLEVIPDEKATDAVELKLEKANYSREEVIELLGRDRKTRELKLALQRPTRTRPFLRVTFLDGRYELALNALKPEDDLFLGEISFTCSTNFHDLYHHRLRTLLDGF